MTNRLDSFDRSDREPLTGWQTDGTWITSSTKGLQVLCEGLSLSEVQVQAGWVCRVCGEQFKLDQRLKAVRENGDDWHWAHEQCENLTRPGTTRGKP